MLNDKEILEISRKKEANESLIIIRVFFFAKDGFNKIVNNWKDSRNVAEELKFFLPNSKMHQLD